MFESNFLMNQRKQKKTDSYTIGNFVALNKEMFSIFIFNIIFTGLIV